MRLSRIIAIATIIGACGAPIVSAKSLQEGSSPVNFPPDDFAGGSFVDNDGCIYIRAGVDGSTTWVPRVGRDRQLICDREPTFGEEEQVAAPAVEEATPEAPTEETEQTAATEDAAPAPAVTGDTRPQARADTASAAPAAEAPAADTETAAAATTASAPKPAVAAPAPTKKVAALPPVPEGYKRAWNDGRLNPLRGIPDANANRAEVFTRGVVSPIDGRKYDIAWSNYLPRLLYDRTTGMVVGDKFPGMIYPNLDPSRAVPQATISAKSPSPFMTRGPAKPNIQAATFADMDKARAAAQRLANAGLPTRIGKYTKDGQERQVILVGPFSTNGDVKSALEATVRLGFERAVPRK